MTYRIVTETLSDGSQVHNVVGHVGTDAAEGEVTFGCVNYQHALRLYEELELAAWSELDQLRLPEVDAHELVEVCVRHVYGKPLAYPVSDQAKKLADLLGVKTFTDRQLKAIAALGFWIDWVPDPTLTLEATA